MALLSRAFKTLAVIILLAVPAAAAERGISVATPGAIPQGAWGTYHALIIGIDDYQQWPRLRTAVKDATALSRVMVDRYGFKKDTVVLRTDRDANRLQIIADIRALATSMTPDDNLLIYFAGHGQLDDLTGDGYWIPVDGQAKNPGTWIANSFLKAVLSSEKVAAKNVVVIADSCYSGAMLRGGPSLLTVDGDYAGKLAKAAARRSRQVISSGGVEPVADGGADGHSLFAYYFLKALRENDLEVMDLENLFHTRVWKPVTEIGNQRPNVGRLKTPMDDDGQFVLYNQAWVAGQQNRDAENRRQAEAADRKTAEEMDRSSALQAERQRLELERQKLEMEKELLVQKQQVELWKLKLEKQKQEMEFQKMAQQLEAMKQKTVAPAEMPALASAAPPEKQKQEMASRKIAPQREAVTQKTESPPAATVLASVSPKTAAAPRVDGATTTFAILPIEYRVDYKGFGNPLTMANALIAATARQKGLVITHSVYDDTAAPDTEVIHLSLKETASIWKSASMFSDPEPDMDRVVAIGRKIGVDYAYCAFVKQPERLDVRIYLFDIARNRKHMAVLENVFGWSLKDATEKALDKMLGDLQDAPPAASMPASVSVPGKQKQGMESQKTDAPPAAPVLASVSPKTAAAARVDGATTFAILPIEYQVQTKIYGNTLTIANALVDATAGHSGFVITHSVYDGTAAREAEVVHLSSKETAAIWKSSDMFSDPEPDMDRAVALGRKLGVDYAYCAFVKERSGLSAHLYLFDIASNRKHVTVLEKVAGWSMKAMTEKALDKMLVELQDAPPASPGLASVSPKAAAKPRVEGTDTTFAVLPMKMQKWGVSVSVLTLANALADAIGNRQNVHVSHSFYPNIYSPDDAVITLTSKETNGVWTQPGFSAAPEPDVKSIVALGNKLGVDYAYCVSSTVDSQGSYNFDCYIIDIKKKEVQSSALKSVGYLSVKQALATELDKTLNKMGLGKSR